MDLSCQGFGFVIRLHYFLPHFSFRQPMSENDRLINELAEMEANMTQTVSTLAGKIQEIQYLDSKLTELMKETNPEKEFKAKLLEIKNNQREVIMSFDALEKKLDNYNKTKQNVASTVICFQIFVHAYILTIYFSGVL